MAPRLDVNWTAPNMAAAQHLNGGSSTDRDHTSDYVSSSDRKSNGARKSGFRDWLEHSLDWSWFTCTQSTGGIAILLANCPKQFTGLQTIASVIYIFNIAVFLVFASIRILQCIFCPAIVRRSFVHFPECLMFGSFWLTMATIIIGMAKLGTPHAGPWLTVAIRVCFWTYAAITLCSATLQFTVLIKAASISSLHMNPGMFLVFFQAMLTGSVASAIVAGQPPAQRMPILVAAIGYQGLGVMGTMTLLPWFLTHLMHTGCPEPSHRPGLFMTVGAIGYTVVAFIGNARAIPTTYGVFAEDPTSAHVLKTLALWASIFIWVFGFWLFAVALTLCLEGIAKRSPNGKWSFPMTFDTSWWGMSIDPFTRINANFLW